MAHSKSRDAMGTVRVFFDGLPVLFASGELAPTLRISYDEESLALTFTVGLGGDRVMSVQEVEIRPLIQAMEIAGLVYATSHGHYVVRLPNGSSYRGNGFTEINLPLARSTLRIGKAYDDVSFPFIAPMYVVRVRKRGVGQRLGLRFGTKAVKLMIDVDARQFFLALLHLGALSPMGAPDVRTGVPRDSYHFMVGLPSRPLHPPRDVPGGAA